MSDLTAEEAKADDLRSAGWEVKPPLREDSENTNELLALLRKHGYEHIQVSQLNEDDPFTATIMQAVTTTQTTYTDEYAPATDEKGQPVLDPATGEQYLTRQRTPHDEQVESLEPTKQTATAPTYQEALIALLEQVK